VTLPKTPIRLHIASTPAHLPVVRAATEKLCRLAGFDDETAGMVVLCVDEALTNIIRHAYDGAADHPIEVELAPLTDGEVGGIEIRLRDYGKVTSPQRIRPRDLADVRPGGLGTHIIRQCMDHVDYRAADGGGTLLTLRKRLGSACREEGA